MTRRVAGISTVKLTNVSLHTMQLPLPAAPEQEAVDLVFIHGLAANLGFWYACAANFFSPFGRVTLFDLRGHGLSSTPHEGYSVDALVDDVRELFDAVGISQGHVVAHSFGGLVALTLAHRHPERVKSLVLADVRIPAVQPQLTLSEWSQWPALRGWLAQSRVDLDGDDPEGGMMLLTAMARARMTANRRRPQVQNALMPGQPLFGGRRAASRWLSLLEKTSAYSEIVSSVGIERAELAQLHQPILALYGANSMTVPSGEALAQDCPNCTYTLIEDAGHFFPVTQPRKFGEHAGAFLRQVLGWQDQPAEAQRL